MSDEFSSKQIMKGTAVTSSLTILSRILGFFRDLIVALVFGAGSLADAYFVAFRIPNLLRSFVAEGALSAAFVPIFSSEARKGTAEAQHALRSVTSFLVVTTVALTLLGIIFAEEVVGAIAPGFESSERELCILLTRIMLPYIVFISLIAMINGALTSLKTFGAAAAAQSIMNMVLIAGGLVSAFYEPATGVIILSVSVLIGGLVQVLYQIPALRRLNLSLQFGFSNSRRIIGELVSLMAPALLGATVYQLVIFSATVLASLLESGAVSWLFYADRVVQLPIGIFSVALGSVLLPALAANHAAANARSFADNLANSLRYTSFVIIPVSALIFISAPLIVPLLFQRGVFDAHASAMTAGAVQALSLGIWAASCHSLIARAFIARRDNVTPTLIGVLTLVINLLVSLMLMGPIEAAQTSMLARALMTMQRSIFAIVPDTLHLGHIGLALASSAASLCAGGILALILSARERQINWSGFVRSSVCSLIGSVLACVAALVASNYFSGSLIRLSVLTVVFAAVFWVVSLALRSPESTEVATIIKGRLRRNG